MSEQSQVVYRRYKWAEVADRPTKVRKMHQIQAIPQKLNQIGSLLGKPMPYSSGRSDDKLV